MRPTYGELTLRDPALAALLGVATSAQADFGIDWNHPNIAASEEQANYAGRHDHYGDARQLDIDAHQLGVDNRTIRGLSREDESLLAQLHTNRKATEDRLRLLDPNWGSAEKIGHYTFSIVQAIVLGAEEGISMTNSPLTDIKPERLIFNAPCFNFVTVSTVQVGNTSVVIGGSEDAFNYSNVAVDVKLSMPLLRTSSRALVAGQYSGITPSPYASGSEYNFTATFHGPARMMT